MAGLLPAAGAAAPVLAVSPDVVISQVYGGGGNSGATYTHDFVELFNRGTTSVSLSGWNLQYASSAGSFGTATNLNTPLAGTLAPGQYLLIQEAQGSGGTTPLPTPDVTDSTPIAMSATAGKVRVVDASSVVRDFVGYGAAATEFEGSGPTATLSNTTAASRAGNGCTDTDDNASDFAAGAPNPRNTASPLNPCSSDVAPSVTDVSPADGAVAVNPATNLSVTFSEPVNVSGSWFTIVCGTTGSHTAAVSGGPTTFTLNPDTDFDAIESCTVTILAAQVADQDTQDPPDNMAADFSWTFSMLNVCTQSFTPIYSIQGSGSSAAITGTVTTQGVVVGDFEGSAAASGFYLQDATGDGNAATSDGIFVFTGSSDLVSAGQVVRVTGFARERFNQTAINGSNSNTAAVPAANIVDCGTDSVAPMDVNLPFATATFPERYEGMLVRLPQSLVISEYFNYDRFGEMVLALPQAGESRAFTPTAVVEPGAAAQALALANSLSRITLDDAQSAQNPAVNRHPNGLPFSLSNRFRGGDTVANTVGVLGFDFNLYRIFPTAAADYTATNPRPAAPAPVGGTLKVAAMNTLNYFLTLDYPTGNPLDNKCGPAQTLECRGADFDQPIEFSRQRDKLLAALAGLDADVIGLNEIENSPNVDPAADIASGLNDILGAGTYASISTGTIGTDAIKVGLIYRPATVTPIGVHKILDSSVDPRFIDTKSRPVLAQTFEEIATGGRITVAVNHLKSKGSDCNDVGDPDAGDGQGNCNGTRTLAAQALVDWLATDPTGSGDRDYLIIGDLNSYAMEDPIAAIKAGPDDIAGTADDYVNLIAQYLGLHAYSFVFDGQAGYLDHALASPTLASQVTGVAEWHINADEPDLLDYDTSFKSPSQDALYEANAYRSSDHDPVIVGLNLRAFNVNGFLSPIANAPAMNTTKAGSSVPLKFSLGGFQGLDVLFETPQFTTCAAWPFGGSNIATSGKSMLEYDATLDEYTIVWKTSKSWANTCRTVEVTLTDGSYRLANVTFTK